MNPADSVAWHEALARVPGGKSAPDLIVTPLAGGTANATFRVETGEGSFVVRLHEPYTLDLGVDRRREAILHAAAAGAGLASRILAADPQGRFLVTEYLPAPVWQAGDLANESRLGELADTLRKLHALPAPRVPALDLAGLLAGHAAWLAAQRAAPPAELVPQLARAREILARQQAAGRAPCIVHGDPTAANMIGTAPLHLIDWEYAAVADPLTDLACLLAYYPSLEPRGEMLLDRSGLAGSATPTQLAELAWVYGLAADLWHRRLALARRHPPPAH